MIKSWWFLIFLCLHAFSFLSLSLLLWSSRNEELKQMVERGAVIQYETHGAMQKKWDTENRKSKRGRDDRMRKLTEGDGGSWVNLSSKSSQSRPVPISTSPRQESFSPWPCLLLCLWRKDGSRLSMIGDGHYLNTILEPGPTPQTTGVRLETTLMRKMMGQPVTLSPFINSDKMFQHCSKMQPPTTLTFTQCVTQCICL